MATLIQKWFGEDDRASWLVFCGVFCVFAGAISTIISAFTGLGDVLATEILTGLGFAALGFNRFTQVTGNTHGTKIQDRSDGMG